MPKEKIDINKIELDNEGFKKALQIVQFTHNSLFLTGKAGTGKSTSLNTLPLQQKRNISF